MREDERERDRGFGVCGDAMLRLLPQTRRRRRRRRRKKRKKKDRKKGKRDN